MSEEKDRARLDFFESIAAQGASPALLNDDNGHWAVSFTGMQNCVCGDEPSDVDTTFFVEKAGWKDTVREAIDAAIAAENTEDTSQAT